LRLCHADLTILLARVTVTGTRAVARIQTGSLGFIHQIVISLAVTGQLENIAQSEGQILIEVKI
jgi:hypothetical protein